MDNRFQQLRAWLLNDLNLAIDKLEPASADASFRRYFRAHTAQRSFVVMDAPPDKEAIEPFVAIARALQQQGVHSPRVYETNYRDGFLLLEDLGNTTYLDQLSTQPEPLYKSAIQALIKLQQGTQAQPGFQVPQYDHERLLQEMVLFKDWFINRHLQVDLNSESLRIFKRITDTLIAECQQQPQVWVHRDFHSRNLMITAQNSPGVIDFQDMVVGPIAYDLVSLYKDCYVEWPRAQQLEWLQDYHQLTQQHPALPDFELTSLIRWYDFCGLQRHLKVLGIFCRLHYRDNKQHYLKDLPLVARYVLEVLELYPELREFKTAFGQYIEKAR